MFSQYSTNGSEVFRSNAKTSPPNPVLLAAETDLRYVEHLRPIAKFVSKDFIKIGGAREHNLKNLTLSIPRDKLVVITGLSGSGKSSLAFDTIYAEGQRKYVESLSAYARQFLDQLQKPDVDYIEGLSPAIAIEQRSSGTNPRSIIATTTEIYDYLRLLYANVGVPHCPLSGERITHQTTSDIVDRILTLPPRARIMVLAPVVRGEKGEFRDVIERLLLVRDDEVRIEHQLLAEPVTDGAGAEGRIEREMFRFRFFVAQAGGGAVHSI